MPLRPVVGFLRPRSRSRRTCSTRSECWPRNASIPCRTGSRWTPSRLNSRSAKLSWESRVRLIASAVALRSEHLVVEFTDALQGGLELLIVAQPLLDDGLLFGGEADLLVASTGIADGQHPDEMALTASTDGAAGAMADAAAEQGATKNLGSGGEGGSELGSGFDDCLPASSIYMKQQRSSFVNPFRNIYSKFVLRRGAALTEIVTFQRHPGWPMATEAPGQASRFGAPG